MKWWGEFLGIFLAKFPNYFVKSDWKNELFERTFLEVKKIGLYFSFQLSCVLLFVSGLVIAIVEGSQSIEDLGFFYANTLTISAFTLAVVSLFLLIFSYLLSSSQVNKISSQKLSHAKGSSFEESFNLLIQDFLNERQWERKQVEAMLNKQDQEKRASGEEKYYKNPEMSENKPLLKEALH